MPATKFASRGAQYVLSQVFDVNISDTMATTAGVIQALSTAGAGVYDIALMPQNSIIVGGALMVVTADNATSTATVAIGDSVSATRYLAATDLKTAATAAFTGTYLDNTPGNNIRATITNADGTATVGNFRVKIDYVIRGRINEAQTT